jgi:lipoprotein-releasing system permease protein
MNLPFFVAKRYFIARKKTSFISLISWISMLGVCVGTMALVIVLSVFNGLEAFQKGLFRTFDAELKISAKKGKNFPCTPAFLAKLQAVDGVSTITQVIQESALIRYKEAQMVVTLKGVDDNFSNNNASNRALLMVN